MHKAIYNLFLIRTVVRRTIRTRQQSLLKLDLGRPGVLGLGEIVKHLLRVDTPEQLFLLLEESQPVRGDLSRRDQLGKLPCSSA